MVLGIVGSRTFADRVKFDYYLSLIQAPFDGIVSGGAAGADRLAEMFARDYKIPIQVFNPDWKKHGKEAGFKRNWDIVKNCDVLVAFWNGSSRGTHDSIHKAQKLKKPTLIIYV